MTTQQTDALQCAADLEYSIPRHRIQDAFILNAYKALKMVRTQHARITELESQLAQRFDAADMATAAAQGFRDGVASVSRLTDLQIASVCMSYRHDFGLLDDACKEQLVYDARSWEYAFAKERERALLMERAMPDTYKIKVINAATGEVVKTFETATERAADRAERGLSINLNHADYYIVIEPPKDTK